ncbi:MAG: plasmid recombination protein [Methylophilaceae bacterium]
MRYQTVGKPKLISAFKHNLREAIPPRENIDRTRSHLNRILIGADTAQGIADEARRLKSLSGITHTRKNCAEALEILFSLPISFAGDHEAFFRDCLEWAKQVFDLPVLSFVVHMDEAYMHAHCLLLPVRDGKMQGNPIAGTPAMARARAASFFDYVGKRYGLAMSRKLNVKDRGILEQRVLAWLADEKKPVLQSDIYPIIRDHIRNHPEQYAELLGLITLPQLSP